MRSYSSPELTHLQSRTGVRPRLLVWIRAKRRDTGAIEPAGFWNGDDVQNFTIGGIERSYLAAGALLGMDDITFEIGLSVRRLSIWLATAKAEVVNAAQGYDLRLAPIEVHRVMTDPVSHLAIAPPRRIWKGLVDGAARVTPAKGMMGGRITIIAASAAMALTRGLPHRYSDEAMRKRGADDRLFRYADVSGKVPVYWGEERHVASSAAPGGSGPGGLGGGLGRSTSRDGGTR